MKRLFFILLFSASTINLPAQSIKIEEARKLYAKSAESRDLCRQLYTKLLEIDEKNQNLLLGYKGAVMAEMARYEKNPPQKMKFFKEGKHKLEEAILRDFENIELRFLRLSIQMHSPELLHYKGQITSDKAFIESNLDKLKNESLKKSISDYLVKVDKQGELQAK